MMEVIPQQKQFFLNIILILKHKFLDKNSCSSLEAQDWK